MTEQTEQKAKDRSNLRKVLIGLAALVVVALVAVAAVGGWYLNRVDNALNKVERKPNLLPSTDTGTAVAPKPAGDGKTPMTFVLIGSDSRGEDQGRSDVLMTAYLPGDRKNVFLTSYPRDLWVPIKGHGEAKINAAYAYGGAPLTVSTLQDLTGVKMNHVALIDFEQFIRLTTVLGGVTVNNKVASTSGQYTWPKGKITVMGEEALAYVRQRKQLPNGDFDRAERQRAVVQAIIANMLSRGVLTNPSKFDDLANALADSVVVDETLTTDRMRDIVRGMRVTSANDIISLQAPISGLGWSKDGQSIVLLDKTHLAEMSEAMKTDTMAQFWAKNKDSCSFKPGGC